MRKFCFILTALFCAALFTSCTDDDKDDEGGNGQGGENGDSGVVILPKKVKKIVVSFGDYEEQTTLYTYDAQGRVSTISTTEHGNTTSRVKSFTYTDSKITIKEENNEPMIIELKDGRAISSSEYEGEKHIIQGSYTYSGDYLSKLIKKVVNEDLNDGSWQNYLRDSSIFVVKDGNLDSVDYYFCSIEDGEQKGIMSYVINNERDNNVNLDLYGLLIGEDVILLNLTGTRYKKLPSQLTERDEFSGESDVTHYSYKVDKEGYITELTEAMEGEDEYIYTITYE